MLYAYAFFKNNLKREETMNIFLYIIIFIMGTLFGSFYTLAVYRIPKKIDIIHKHSFCPSCGHRLGFWELIPVLSYIFLGGKCKKCNEKIRPRYFILEILSGFTFVVIAYCLKIDAYNLHIHNILRFIFIVLYLVCIFIIAGIDKDERKIEKSVLYYGIMVSCLYIIYLCIMGYSTSIYRYVMYLVTFILLLIIDTEYQIRTAKQSYLLGVLILIIVMIINTTEFVTIASIFVVCTSILLTKMIYYIKNGLNKHKKEHKDLTQIHKLAYLLAIANVIILIGQMRLFY